MEKVLIITYYWPPSGGASVQRWLKLSKYLLKFDIEPIVLTVDEKYATYPVKDESFNDQVEDGVKVVRTKSFEVLKVFSFFMGEKKVPYGGFSNVDTTTFFSKVTRFLRGNLLVPDARVGWNRYAFRKAKKIIEENKIQTVITTSPPHSSQLIGLKLKRKLGINWIVDINDPWTDIYYYKDLLHLGFVKKIDKKHERTVVNVADRIIANCNSNKGIFQSKLENPNEDKFIIVPNGYDADDFPEKPSINKSEFVFTYTGTIAEKYDADVLFECINELKEQFSEIKFKLLFVGTVSPSVKADIRKYGIEDVTEYTGQVSHKQATDYAVNATVLINIFPKTDHDKGVPGKLGNYLATKKPIVSISPVDGDSAEILRHTGAGKSFNREMKKEMMEYLRGLVEAWKQNPESLINTNENIYFYSREYGAGEIAKLIKSLK